MNFFNNDRPIHRAALEILERLCIRWESQEAFEERQSAQWPILKRGDLEAHHLESGWLILDRHGNAVAFGATNSEAWLSHELGVWQ
jgi:hypothetical protein